MTAWKTSEVKVRNKAVFESVQTYLLNNFGATTSLNNILKDLEKQGVHIKRETLNRYIKILQDAKILYRCNRFDLKSRRSLAGEQKYYLADCAFYFAMNTDNRINYGPVLENIVYTYARSQNYAVSIGRIGKLECDFILRDEQMQYAYVQVAMTIMNSRETEDREYRPLEQIADNYPKFVMTRGDMIQKRNGIRHVNLPEFIIVKGATFCKSAKSCPLNWPFIFPLKSKDPRCFGASGIFALVDSLPEVNCESAIFRGLSVLLHSSVHNGRILKNCF